MDQFAYLGTGERAYPQYLDVTGGGQKPLEAAPGGAYSVAVVPGWTDSKGKPLLPVPPGDGLWNATPLATASGHKAKAVSK